MAQKRFNLNSIAYSWLMAIGFLSVIGVWAQPPKANDHSETLIQLPARLLESTSADFDRVKATVWCALEGNQVAILSNKSQTLRIRGSMALAPEWRGETLSAQDQSRLNSCVDLRLDHLSSLRNQGNANDRPAFGFLFKQ